MNFSCTSSESEPYPFCVTFGCRHHLARTYFVSVLELLIDSGVLFDGGARARVFERRFTRINLDSLIVGMYTDVCEDSSIDAEAHALLQELLSNLEATVEESRRLRYDVNFSNCIDLESCYHQEYLRCYWTICVKHVSKRLRQQGKAQCFALKGSFD